VFGLDVQLVAMGGSLVGALAILVWWMFFSRATWLERSVAVGAMAVAALLIRPLTHPSIQNGMMGLMFAIYAIPPTLSLALVGWAAASRGLSEGARRAAMVVAIVLGCGVWTLARTDGLLGGASQLAWRWTPTAEELLLAQGEPTTLTPPVAAPITQAPITLNAPVGEPGATPEVARADGEAMSERAITRFEWPGFRGLNRDGVVHGVRIATNWSVNPPVEMWRRPIGPGWSSFSVSGDLLYTQEQRGDDEVVACYRVSTGEAVWRHSDPVRFWESNGGAGPRATPTLSGGRVYAFGATGVLNALDSSTGKLAWSQNAASDTGRPLPGWGFSSSPLVIDDVVVVAAAGTLVAYDTETGARRWTGPSYGGSYSSPHQITVDGVVQVLLLGGPGAISLEPATGSVLWEHEWESGAIVQPAVTADGGILINTLTATGGLGIRRLEVTRAGVAWTVAERWTSNGLKPYFNDFVVHKGFAFGFDGNILSSIDLTDGRRVWKGGRYGNGQLVLLADQDLLLVISEEGELALVRASSDGFAELSRFPVLDGKTWNHPVLVGNTLLVRNGEEMAAFRLSLAR
jgi:outer membrane protein assembly factor BamB